jgi:hypothetical protein
MSTFSNFLAAITTLTAIIIVPSSFLLDMFYDHLVLIFAFGIKKHTKFQVAVNILVYAVIILYALIFIHIVFNQIQTDANDLINYVNYGRERAILFAIITFLIYNYKGKINVIIGKIINGCDMIMTYIVIGLCIVLCVISMYLTIIAMANLFKLDYSNYEIKLYRDGKSISTLIYKDIDSINYGDSLQIEYSNIIVADDKLQPNNGLLNKYYVLYLKNKKMYVPVAEDIEIANNNSILFKVNGTQIGESSKQAAIRLITDFVISLFIPLLLFYILGFICYSFIITLIRIKSIPYTYIQLNNEYLSGKILWKYDDFYLVYDSNKYKYWYIPKEKILNIDVIEINNKLGPKKKRLIKLNKENDKNLNL